MSRESAERGGCAEQRDQTGDVVTLCFMGQETTPAVTEERALVRAARMTLERGKTHFLIEGRKDYRRRLVTTMYGTPISQTEAGFESRLDIRFVDAEGARDCWRCIDAAEIQAALGPIYPSQTTRPGRRR